LSTPGFPTSSALLRSPPPFDFTETKDLGGNTYEGKLTAIASPELLDVGMRLAVTGPDAGGNGELFVGMNSSQTIDLADSEILQVTFSFSAVVEGYVAPGDSVSYDFTFESDSLAFPDLYTYQFSDVITTPGAFSLNFTSGLLPVPPIGPGVDSVTIFSSLNAVLTVFKGSESSETTWIATDDPRLDISAEDISSLIIPEPGTLILGVMGLTALLPTVRRARRIQRAPRAYRAIVRP